MNLMAAPQTGGPEPGRSQLVPGMHALQIQPYYVTANVSRCFAILTTWQGNLDCIWNIVFESVASVVFSPVWRFPLLEGKVRAGKNQNFVTSNRGISITYQVVMSKIATPQF